MNVWCELTHTSEKKKMLSEMVDHIGGGNSQVLYIPLQFWFCRDNGLALPLIALQYHEVKLKISFEENKNLSDTTMVFPTSVPRSGLTTFTLIPMRDVSSHKPSTNTLSSKFKEVPSYHW